MQTEMSEISKKIGFIVSVDSVNEFCIAPEPWVALRLQFRHADNFALLLQLQPDVHSEAVRAKLLPQGACLECPEMLIFALQPNNKYQGNVPN